MLNEMRGEVALILNGVNYILRPSFEVLSNIETQIGKSLFAIIGQFSDKAITLNEQIIIIKAAAIKENGEKINMTDKELGEIILGNNIGHVFSSICSFIQKGLGY